MREMIPLVSKCATLSLNITRAIISYSLRACQESASLRVTLQVKGGSIVGGRIRVVFGETPCLHAWSRPRLREASAPADVGRPAKAGPHVERHFYGPPGSSVPIPILSKVRHAGVRRGPHGFGRHPSLQSYRWVSKWNVSSTQGNPSG